MKQSKAVTKKKSEKSKKMLAFILFQEKEAENYPILLKKQPKSVVTRVQHLPKELYIFNDSLCTS